MIIPPQDSNALRQALRELAGDAARLEHLQVASWLASQTLTWERCVTSYEEVLLDAVRCRYARLHGFAVLPEVDEQECRRLVGDRYSIPEVPVSANEWNR